MGDETKTREQLIAEVEDLRRECASIQAGERIHEEVLSMRSSEDIVKVVAVMWREMVELGIETPGTSIIFVEEGTDWFPTYMAMDNPHRHGIDWTSPQLSEVDERVAVLLPTGGFETSQSRERLLEVWREKRTESFVDNFSISDFIEFLGLKGDCEGLLEGLGGEWTVTNVPFAHGTVGYREREFVEEHAAVVGELARALSLGYVRYLDIREAEEQTRQANRERAAERVRAEAMTMRSGDELRNVVAVMFREMADLDESLLECSITFVNEDEDRIAEYSACENPRKYGVFWSHPDLVEMDNEIVVGVGSHVISEREDDYLERWKKGDVWSFELIGETYWRAAKKLYGMEFFHPRFPEKWNVTVLPFSQGSVSLNVPEFSEESVAIAREFTEALSLGYTRFLDFRRVEEAQQQLIDELEEELQTAREKQMALMPKGAPKAEGVHLAGRCVPANHVGGDFFQYFPREGGGFSVCMADVTGHAMEAAIPVVMFDGVLESQMAMGVGLEELFERLNDLLCTKLDERTFVCFAMGEFDTERGLLRLANGGIPYPLHFHRNSGKIVELEVEAYPLGVRSGVDYPVIEVQLEPGDRVVFCSDGLAEAENVEGEIFGFERTADVVRRGCVDGLSAEGLIERLFEAVRDFSGETPQGDDMTCVVLQVEG